MNEKELCVKLIIYKDYTEMHRQQNIKFNLYPAMEAQMGSRSITLLFL